MQVIWEAPHWVNPPTGESVALLVLLNSGFNNNNRLFKTPHLVRLRAQNIYKDKDTLILSLSLTHTHTKTLHAENYFQDENSTLKIAKNGKLFVFSLKQHIRQWTSILDNSYS